MNEELQGARVPQKGFPRLRELAPAARGGITQPRKSLFGRLCSDTNINFLSIREEVDMFSSLAIDNEKHYFMASPD